MTLTPAQKQSAYRARQSAKMERMKGALSQILTKLEPREGALAKELKAIAEQGLSDAGIIQPEK